MILLKLKERLKECRKNKKLTQEQLSNLIGINRSTYAKYETGENEPDAATLDKFANFFKVSVDYLLGRTDNPTLVEEDREDNDKNATLTFNGERLTEDEQEHLMNELKRYRELKARLLKEKGQKN